MKVITGLNLKLFVQHLLLKLMLKGGHNFDTGDDLIRKAVFITTSIYGEHHPDKISDPETLSKLARLLSNSKF